MIVIKVGGSLFTHPQLGPCLCAHLDTYSESILVVPGGGPLVDAIRTIDTIHKLGEEASHWLALRALDTTADFLRRLLTSCGRTEVLNCLAFAREDEARPDALPHSWAVTSDSIAARAAIVFNATRLVLLKSIDIPSGMDWQAAAANGLIDVHFPSVLAGLDLPVQVINFRQHLESFSHPA